MQSEEIRKRFLAFFEKRGHAIVPSASLVPENDPSVLFTTAGMQPLVPYLMGQKHPKGDKIANIQKCVRTQDIDEVGDNTHDTFFEMLGNWSLGSYFKKEAIRWSYEFLTDPIEGLDLDASRLYITVFAGDENAPRDTESFEIWHSLGIPENHIYFMDAKSNWWSPGDNGPCGPDTEMFYDTAGGLNLTNKADFLKADDEQKVVEVWNDVFMEYEKLGGRVVGKLDQQNVDTGAGLERLVMVMQGKDNIFDTDLFADIMAEVRRVVPNGIRKQRIVADHMRTSVFLIADGVVPSNTDQGYVLRRLIRRAMYHALSQAGTGAHTKTLPTETVAALVGAVVRKYGDIYPNLRTGEAHIVEEITKEAEKFARTLAGGLKEFEKIAGDHVSGKEAFNLYQSYGFPIEMTTELAEAKGMAVDSDGFSEEMRRHQDLSRTGAEKRFKGGLADSGEKTVMLHTATHLMLAGLRKYLGDHVHQAGSNITEERTRFDFTHPEKVSRETLDKVEAYVNEAIGKGVAVSIEQMKKEDAQESGVEGSFWEKYPDTVNVYVVKDDEGTVYSRELCGGPHVENTGNIKGTFKIIKEEASSAGVRRVKGVLA